jgi:peptidoglycan/LPS O-acetylase OafA/YrhL
LKPLSGIISDRNFGLDVVRVYALALILIQHGSFDYEIIGRSKVGPFAAEIFFVLSGFLIGGMLMRDLDKNQPPLKTFRMFVVRRWWRILPLYYLILIVAVLDKPEVPVKSILHYALFIQGFNMVDGFFIHSWTLGVEEWFYIAAPAFMILVCSLTRDYKKVIRLVMLFMASIVVLRMMYIGIRGPRPGDYWIMKGIPPFRFDSLFCGVLLAYLSHIKHAFYTKLQSRKYFFAGIAICLAYVLLLQFGGHSPYKSQLSVILPTIGFLFLSVAIAIVLPYCTLMRKPDLNKRYGRFIYSFFTYTSVMTYAIYLWHAFFYEWFSVKSNIGAGAMRFLMELLNSQALAYGLFFVARLAVIYVVAYITFRFFEKPLLKVRDRLTGIQGMSLPA